MKILVTYLDIIPLGVIFFVLLYKRVYCINLTMHGIILMPFYSARNKFVLEIIFHYMGHHDIVSYLKYITYI